MAQGQAVAGAISGTATLLALKRDGELRTYLLSKRANIHVAATHLANAVGATAKQVEFPADDLASDATGEVIARFRQAHVNLLMKDLDVSQAAKSLSVMLPENAWLAVTFRKPRAFERRRHYRWILTRTDALNRTHPSAQPNSRIATIKVGAPTTADVRAIIDQVPSVIGGFDYYVKARVRTGTLPFLTGLALALILFGVGRLLDWPTASLVWALIGVLSVALVAAVMWRLSGRMSAGRALKWILARPPTQLVPIQNKQNQGHQHAGEAGKVGPYPLRHSTFLLGPDQFVPVGAPLSTTSFGGVTTRGREMSSVFAQPIGPLIGESVPGGQPAHLSAADAWRGIFISGEAGSGKTVLVREEYAWNLLEQKHPSGRPGFPGRQNTLIAFDNKGAAEASMYVKWGQALGRDVRLSDMLDPKTFTVDLVPKVAGGIELNVVERATAFMEAMAYAFADGSIQYRSRDTLVQLLAGGLVVAEFPGLAEAAGLEGGRSFVYYADVLCGRLDDARALRLAQVVMSEAVRDKGASRDLLLARDQLLPLFGDGVTKAKRVQLSEAPKSKLGELMRVEAMWEPSRERASWEAFVGSWEPLVFNFGRSSEGRLVAGETAQIISSMLMFTLRTAIAATCGGWRSMGRRVSIFSDELSLLAGSDPGVFRWFRDQGREYGVQTCFATQYVEQLDVRLQDTMLGYGTVVAFAQGNPDMSRRLAAMFASDGSEWDAADVVNLPRYTAIVRATADGERQPAFTVRIGYWEENMGAYQFEQGYGGQAQPSLWDAPIGRGDEQFAPPTAPQRLFGPPPTQAQVTTVADTAAQFFPPPQWGAPPSSDGQELERATPWFQQAQQQTQPAQGGRQGGWQQDWWGESPNATQTPAGGGQELERTTPWFGQPRQQTPPTQDGQAQWNQGASGGNPYPGQPPRGGMADARRDVDGGEYKW